MSKQTDADVLRMRGEALAKYWNEKDDDTCRDHAQQLRTILAAPIMRSREDQS